MIRQLPPQLVERIAAGEVIERPASVLKELVENAIDAGAKRVDVEIEQGGRSLIRVADDGRGIARDDLPLAFAPHATSKLTELDDLLAIASYGFRGEALSSIGAVAQARIVSRAAGCIDGFEVASAGGAISAVRPCAAPPGTVIEARNLFFNVPARLRFLKGVAAETSRCIEHAARFAVACEDVALAVTADGRRVLDVPASSSRRDRIRAAFGAAVADALLPAERASRGIHVEAWLGPPHLAKARAMHQHLFLNGRAIKDGTVRAAVTKAFREFTAPSLQPVFFVLLAVDPATVDVNVHPAKLEVRFREPGAVFQAVHAAVLDGLRRADLAPRPKLLVHGLPAAGERRFPTAAHVARPLFDGMRPIADEPAVVVVRGDGIAHVGEEPAVFAPAVPERSGPVLRLFETYVAYPSGDDLVLVDQHALHERVLYEDLRRERAAGAVRMQRLLVPEIVEVGRAGAALAAGLEEELRLLGLEMTPFGEEAVAVHALPLLLSKAHAANLVHGILEPALDDVARDEERGAAIAAAAEERLHTLACRGAVKAGDHLADGEIAALLDRAARMPEAKACPHGRPTSLRIPRRDLEGWFKRSGF